jgi:hypothetical protein
LNLSAASYADNAVDVRAAREAAWGEGELVGCAAEVEVELDRRGIRELSVRWRQRFRFELALGLDVVIVHKWKF